MYYSYLLSSSSIDVAAKNDYCQFDKHMSMVQMEDREKRKERERNGERVCEGEGRERGKKERNKEKKKEEKRSMSFRLALSNDQVTFPPN